MSRVWGLFRRFLAPLASIFRRDRGRQPADGWLDQMAAVFDSTHDGVIVTRADGRIVAANPSACAITGYSESELVGSNINLLRSDRHDRDFYRTMLQTVSAEGRWQGEMWNRRKSGELYAERATITAVTDGKGRPVSYVATFSDVSLLKQTEEQLAKLVHHDPLTGLPNRLLLLTRLEHAVGRAKREGHTGALLFLDLDRFKNVNDSLGHPAGDQLLQMVATRLGQRLRDTDTFARLGGDEFAVLLDDLPQPRHAAAVAHSLIDEMEEPFTLCGQEVFIGTSIGISIFPTDSDKPDRIIGNADAALYQAKRGGRTTFRFYTEALGRATSVRLEMETRLRRGIEQEELVLHYQPLVSVADRSLLGVEALVRWRDATLGLVPPASFIPLAEESGLIIRLGDWVLRQACRQMKAWLDAGLTLDLMSVNLSPLQFRQPGLADEIRRVIDETGLPPECLELEITESALVEYGLEAETKLEVLKAQGVRLAIDDFGTGYSSLAYLKRFPIDKLKVDQTFVRNIPHDQADMEITSAVIGLARNLHMEVSAEGVETEAQFAFLRDQGCQSVQGNLFSRPVPSAEIARLCAGDGNGVGASPPGP